ncbi:response regulator [Psychroserpens ponticola]|uniref:Response regulator n=1 Tax=Psychroserpens ponticola TaxID=2932268 RepID=A0ABY7RVM3_9FLAO|nr:response regulator [Psychroserpens ponticola]WCO00740.1 response regulator [Psychroserpens ponticola]
MIKKNILIVEDEVLIAKQIENIISKHGYNCLGIAISYEQALKYLHTTLADAVLLDINIFGQKSGIDLAKVIKAEFGIPIIYLTSYSDSNTIEELIKTQPEGYLVKPINTIVLTTNLDLIFANQNTNTSNIISFNVGKTNYRLDVSELMYIKSESNYLELHLNEDQKLIRFSLKEFLKLLPPNLLYKINRRVAINPDFISQFNSSTITMTNGDTFKISNLLKEDLPFKN